MAEPKSVRWAGSEDSNPEIMHVLSVIRSKTGITLSPTDFVAIEDRNLANNHYTMLAQVASGVPIRSQSVRLWTSLKTGDVIQVEARVDQPPATDFWSHSSVDDVLSSGHTMELVRSVVNTNADDPFIRSVDWKDYWDKGNLVRIVKVKGKRGTYTISISVQTQKVIEQRYHEFPQGDGPTEFTIPVQIYPICEEVEARVNEIPRIESELRHLLSKVHRTNDDPYLSLRTQRYQTLQDLSNPVGIPYARLPQLSLNYDNLLAGAVLANVQSEAVWFRHPQSLSGQRFQAYPSVKLPIDTVYGFLTPKLGWNVTHYELDDTRKPTRSLPIFSLERILGIDVAIEGDEDVDSVGGLIMAKLGDLPHEGQKIGFDGFDIVVKKMNGPRIVLVKVYPAARAVDAE